MVDLFLIFVYTINSYTNLDIIIWPYLRITQGGNMKKKILIFFMAFAIILPGAFLLTACGKKEVKSTGISVVVNNVEGNIVNINYTDYNGQFEPSYLSSLITVYLNKSDNTQSQIDYGTNGYSVSGLPTVLNANEQGYELTISYDNFSSKINLVVHKGEIDMSEVSWNYDASYHYTYNEYEYSVELNNLPNEVTPNYTNNVKINAGQYRAEVAFDYDTTNYKLVNINFDYYIDWQIEKKQIDMQYVYWNYNEPFTYNGSEQSISLQNLPYNVTAQYLDNVKTNAGTYTAVANLVFDSDNYELVNINFETEKVWTINKAIIDLSSIYWSNDNFTYNTQTKQVNLNGNIPSNVSVLYSGQQEAVNAGTYSVSVSFEYDEANYQLNLPQNFDYSHEWKIDKASIYLGNVQWSNTEFTYNETEKSVYLTGIDNIDEITDVTYENYRKVDGEYQIVETNIVDAGEYKTVVTLIYDNANFKLTNKNFENEIEWIINKAENKISGLLKIDNWSYGEEPNTPTGLQAQFGTITYKYYILTADDNYQEIDGVPTNAGTYYVKAFSEGNNNWESVEDSVYYTQFKIYSVMVANPYLEQGYYIYTQNAITPKVINLPEDIEITISGDTSKTEIGNYSIIISLVDTNNYYWAEPENDGTVILNWQIISSPLTNITLNGESLDVTEFENINTLSIYDELGFVVESGFSCNIEELYYDKNTGNETITNYAFDEKILADYNSISFTIKIIQNAQTIYTKLIKVDRNIFEKVVVGEMEMSFDEFKENPVVKYGDELSIIFKTKYQDYYTFYSYPYVVKNDFEIIIYTPTNDIFDKIDIVCRMDILTNIGINGQSITFEELTQMHTISFGSTLSFTVNEEFADVIEITTNKNGQDVILSGQQSFTFDNMNSLYFSIKECETQNFITSINLNVIFFENIEINNNLIDTSQVTYINYNRDLNEDLFTFTISEDLINEYELYYETNFNYTKVKITQSTFQLSIQDIKENLYFYILINDDWQQVLTIYFVDFCPIKTITAQVYQQNYINSPQFEVNGNVINIFSNGAIIVLDIEFKNNYENCTYKIFDNHGTLIDDFTTIKDQAYTLKIYLNTEEIYSMQIKVKYQFYNLIESMQYLGDANVASLITYDSVLNVPNLMDTENYTNQIMTFNGNSSVMLTEGQQIIEVVYSFVANQKTFNYSFNLIVEYVSQEQKPTQYVSNIAINYLDKLGNTYTINFNQDLLMSNGSHELTNIAFVEEKDILIDTYGYEVVSKEIKFLENKTVCWLEYVLLVDGQNKTFKAYINTYGTIFNNVNAQFIFSDAKTEQNITDLIVNDSYTIEKVNVFGEINITLEDENARIEYFYNGETISRENFELNSIGTYTVKITSSDNTTTRSINFIVLDYENLMFEVFYENERLYLEYSNNGLLGNMKMDYDALTGPYFIGYFGKKDLSGLSQISISGNTAYEDMLYYSDKETPITNLDNLVLNLMTDLDGSITEIVDAKYVLVYAKVDNAYYAVYFIFENRPPYPMTFNFDTDNNGEINENDTQISLKINLDEIDTGIVDLGDFIAGESGAIIYISRQQIGMGENETSVSVIVKWDKTYADYSYNYTLEEVEYGVIPDSLVGPSTDSLETILNLDFTDTGNGILQAEIKVCAEGTTEKNFDKNLIAVTFILQE